MVLEMRPAHDPTKAYGFVGRCCFAQGFVRVSLALAPHNGAWDLKKVIEVPAEPADPEKLPAMLKDFKSRASARFGHQFVARRINFFTYPAGELGRCCSTNVSIHSVQRRLVQCGLAELESCAAPEEARRR